MAKFTSFAAILVWFLATVIGVLVPKVASNFSGESIAPSPEYGVEDSPDFIESGEYEANFLDTCTKQISNECGTAIFTSIFLKNEVITEDCCQQLVKMGLRCHNGLVRNIISIPEFKANQSITLPRSTKIWNKCTLVTWSFSPSPSPSDWSEITLY